MEGYVHPDFDDVGSVFRHQLRRTRGGAAAAVYHRGELVVDVWGGHRSDDGDLWRQDTLAMCFSTTKGVASTALHVLASRGEVRYDEPVASYWPEFAQNGKDRITVRHVMSHSAGLHRLRSIIPHAERMLDWEHMVDALAAARPAYEPGTKSGYHAITYGWLVGEIVRRVSGLPIEQFIEDEISRPLGLDGLYLGCPPEERHRVAPLEPFGVAFGPPALQRCQERAVEYVSKLFSLVRSPLNPRRVLNALVPRGMEDFLYDPELLDVAVPAVNGHFSARSLARMYAMISGHGEIDGVRLLSPEIVAEMGQVQHRGRDLVLVAPMHWRLGYHRVLTTRGPVNSAFGHFGFGGSGAWADPSRDLAVAMVCNRGTGTPIGDFRLLQLGTAALQASHERSAPELVRVA